MTSRERVLASFAHEEPDRVPCWCGSSAEFWAKAKAHLGLEDEALRQRFHDDFRRVTAPYVAAGLALGEGAHSRTPFGIERRGLGYGQPMNHPLADADLTAVDGYAWPDPGAVDVSRLVEDAAPFREEYAILGGDWSPFWHDAIELMGMDRLYYAMFDAPEVVDAVFGRVVDYYAESSRRIFEAAAGSIDVFFIGNDFGSQTGPLLGEPLFRRFVLPHLERLIRLGHDYGKPVMLHCCGGVAELIPAMLEAGLDALHAVQTTCEGMDLRRLKADFGNRLLFNGAIDSHHVLIGGTPEAVRTRTREVLEIMMPGGGYVAGASHDSILEETPVENVIAMFDTVIEHGVYA